MAKPVWGYLASLWRAIYPPRSLGQRGEDAAARLLKRHGCKVLARGSRSALGEIDLVVLDGTTIVFVEVKTRRRGDTGHPSEAVDAAKKRRLARLALGFLKRYRLLERPVRFDVVAVTWPEGRRRPLVEHFPAAFEVHPGES